MSESAVPVWWSCTVYLKNGATIISETTDPEALDLLFRKAIDAFHKPGWFRKRERFFQLNVAGKVTTTIPIENINFYGLRKKENDNEQV